MKYSSQPPVALSYASQGSHPVAMPQSVLESELGARATTAYSQRLNTSFAPRSNYERDLAAMQAPFLLVAGQADEAFIAEAYELTIAAQTDTGT